ncbi:SDR family NAD(P)-dependent oxidoreductase [Pseudoalteromonas maricaloris]|uniref:SDR family NAD(P)-dependent oxidoreductase n=1 Tax=Pseudoalteromonas maricaloris TaxID=184924 RepID=UPI003C28D0C3
MFSLENKIFLVTGATGYLGREISKGIAAAGGKVLVNARTLEKAESLCNEIESLGGIASPAIFDVCDSTSIKEWASQQSEIDGIVNNAYAGEAGTIESATAAQFLNAYSIAVIAANELFQSVLPLLRKSAKSGNCPSVVNISSMYGFVSPDLSIYESKSVANPPFYGAAKAALHQWSKYGAVEFGCEGIRFNTVSPGPFPNTKVQQDNPEFVSKLIAKSPMNRIGKPDEISGPTVFLLSPAASYVTGSNIAVNGGWTAI